LTLACGENYILKKNPGLATLSVDSGGEWDWEDSRAIGVEDSDDV